MVGAAPTQGSTPARVANAGNSAKAATADRAAESGAHRSARPTAAKGTKGAGTANVNTVGAAAANGTHHTECSIECRTSTTTTEGPALVSVCESKRDGAWRGTPTDQCCKPINDLASNRWRADAGHRRSAESLPITDSLVFLAAARPRPL